MYYCKIVAPHASRPNPGVIMLHFQMFNDTDNQPVTGMMTHGFNVVTHNVDGTVKSETAAQKRSRMKAEFDAYAERLITDATLVDANFAAILTMVENYRYPVGG